MTRPRPHAFFIDGDWAAPAGTDTHPGGLAALRAGRRDRARGQRPADIDAAVAAARRAFD